MLPQVFSSIIAAWSDVKNTVPIDITTPPSAGDPLIGSYITMVQNLNIGYFWMLANCVTSAAYVSPPISFSRE